MRETKSEAIQAKRGGLAGQRHTVTSLGWLRYRFDAHPPAHSDRGSPRRSGSFTAFAFSPLLFPRPAHRTPRIQGAPSHADGHRRYALAFVAACFLPPLSLRPRSPSTVTEEAQRFRFAEPSGSSVSRKLCACRANPESASLPAPRQPAAETAHPPSTLADHQRTPPEGHQGDQPSSRSLPCYVCVTGLERLIACATPRGPVTGNRVHCPPRAFTTDYGEPESTVAGQSPGPLHSTARDR